MPSIGEFYTGFTRIDLDTRGGYARVAEVKTNGQMGFPEFCAFKVMRHEIQYAEGVRRFEEEMKLLTEITKDEKAPRAITKIYDSGFVPEELSISLHKGETLGNSLGIIRTGLDIGAFFDIKSKLEVDVSNRWLPYLVIELAPYDSSLFRQISSQPREDHEGLFRFSTGEVIIMAVQLLDVMRYLHEQHGRAYLDWKSEHIHWNSANMQVKLIDWNVTIPLESPPGVKINIRDELRLFCSAVLYTSLTFVDPDDPTKPIGPRPTKELEAPIQESRRRYLTDNPTFYQRDITLDKKIKQIVRKGLHPIEGFDSIEELRRVLVEYAQDELGVTESELTLRSEPSSPYLQAIAEVGTAQRHLYQAQQKLMDAVKTQGSKAELTRLFDVIKHALRNFPTT